MKKKATRHTAEAVAAVHTRLLLRRNIDYLTKKWENVEDIAGLLRAVSKVQRPNKLIYSNDNKRHLHARAFFDAHMCDVDHGA